MRLIAVEDYADWKGVRMQEVYQLVGAGELKISNQTYGGLKRLTLVLRGSCS